jgi:3-hydroxyacyl-CoA dehydrogenase
MALNYKNVTVAGSGVLGSQIAFQTAYKGFQVTVYDINNEVLEAAKDRIAKLMTQYQQDLGATQAEVDAAYDRMSFKSELSDAVVDADLVIEAIPEVVSIKTDFYTNLGQVAPAKTIFASNSSTLLPSQFAQATGRPSQFLALHFANNIWKNNTAEIMKHPGTDEKVFGDVVDFARTIGMVALPIYKEQPGYILNSLLVPFLDAAQRLLARGIAEPETIDKTWMVGTGSPRGPFGMLDVIGLTTPYNISAQDSDPEKQKVAELLKTEYIDKGKLGVATGEGFYKYPNPAYQAPDFLKS